MTQHTPGPWKNVNGIIFGADGYSLGERHYLAQPIGAGKTQRRDTKEIEANARLIAAAPELLEAALEVIAVIRNPEAQPTVDKLRAAIRKAKGEP